MALKVLMKRVPRTGEWRDLNDALRELRILAMSQPGYLSGETMLSATDQGTTMVISEWTSITHWKGYENSPQRQAILARLEPILAEPTVTEIWVESPVIG